MTYISSCRAEDMDRDWIWTMLSSQAYWAKWRTRADVEFQLDHAWRIVGVYHQETGRQVGYARASSDQISDAYLADVIVDPLHRGNGIGKLIVKSMIDDGPGSRFRWMLFTADAHGLYEQFGFGPADHTAMVRPADRPPSLRVAGTSADPPGN